MAKERKPRMPDPMQFAIAIVEGVTGEKIVERPGPPAKPVKSPAAVARGKARAAKLTQAERSAGAKKAAAARWKKQP